ncbi:MAG: TRAP transporter large permease, partial [Oscillospiraceae bacterium]|nr:TRAP transporter large permease [Oscillospiraceae bacterium]
GGIGIMIPPSTTMIIYGEATENSIGELFAAGILPGILMAVLYILAIIFMVKRDPSLAPGGEKCSWGERIKSLRNLIGIVVLFLIVLGGMFSGFFTVNEAAAIGALASLVLMFFRHSFTWQNFYHVIMDTITTSGMVLLLVIGASVFGSFLTVTKLPTTMANWLIGLNVSRYVILLFLILIYFILGMIMDELPMVMLTIPIFYPVITSLGFNSIWFGVIIVLVTALGNITPPVGVCCFVLSGIAKDIPMSTIFRGIWPFVLVLLLTVVILTIFPSIATWLPNLLYA